MADADSADRVGDLDAAESDPEIVVAKYVAGDAAVDLVALVADQILDAVLAHDVPVDLTVAEPVLV